MLTNFGNVMKKVFLFISISCIILYLMSGCKGKTITDPADSSADTLPLRQFTAIHAVLNNIYIRTLDYSYLHLPNGVGQTISRTDTAYHFCGLFFEALASAKDSISRTSNQIYSLYSYRAGDGFHYSSNELRESGFVFDLKNHLISSISITHNSSGSSYSSPGSGSSSNSNFFKFNLKRLPYTIIGDTMISVSLGGMSIRNYIDSLGYFTSSSQDDGIGNGGGSRSSSSTFLGEFSVTDSSYISITIK